MHLKRLCLFQRKVAFLVAAASLFYYMVSFAQVISVFNASCQVYHNSVSSFIDRKLPMKNLPWVGGLLTLPLQEKNILSNFRHSCNGHEECRVSWSELGKMGCNGDITVEFLCVLPSLTEENDVRSRSVSLFKWPLISSGCGSVRHDEEGVVTLSCKLATPEPQRHNFRRENQGEIKYKGNGENSAHITPIDQKLLE